MGGVTDKPPGKVGRPSLRKGEGSIHVGIRLPQSEYDRVLAAVGATNARLEAQGLPPLATVSTHLRQVIAAAHPVGKQAPKRVEAEAPEPESVPDVANGHMSDERTVRPPLHGKRVRREPPVPGGDSAVAAALHGLGEAPTPAPPVVYSEVKVKGYDPKAPAPATESGGPPTDEDMEAMLRGSPL